MTVRRLHGAHKEAGAKTSTSLAFWGKGITFNGGVAWRHRSTISNEVAPVGMLLQNVTAFSFGYGEGIALLANGKCQCWGQNGGGNTPWTTGPEGKWTGPWEYRAATGTFFSAPEATNFGLKGQIELEEAGFHPEAIELKERKLEIPERSDGKKALAGQVVYEKGHVATNPKIVSGKLVTTWEALKENVAVEPSTDSLTWIPRAPQVQMFEKPLKAGGSAYLTFAYNLVAPVTCPQLAKVIAVSAVGTHGIALLEDGTVRMWGHGLRYSGFGTSFNSSFGPKVRAKRPPPKRSQPFIGTLTSGSPTITGIEHMGEQHNRVPPATCSFGLGKRKGSFVLFPEGEPVLLPVNTSIVSADVREVGELGEEQTKEQAEKKEPVANPWNPTRAKIVAITLSQNATGNYTGTLKIKKAPAEQPFWPNAEATSRSAGWPITPAMPAEVKCTAVATNGNGNSPITLALTTAGKVLAWGASIQGACGQGGSTFGIEAVVYQPSYVLNEAGAAALEGITAIGTGEETSYAINTAHEVLMWGNLENGLSNKKRQEEGTGHTTLPVKVEGLPSTASEANWPVQVVGNRQTVYVLLKSGDVWSWGGNQRGELGNGAERKNLKGEELKAVSGKKSGSNKEPWDPVPVKIAALSNVTSLAAGRYHAAAVTTAGKILVWGDNEFGQIGNGHAGRRDKGLPVGAPSEVNIEGREALAPVCSEYNTLVLIKGSTPIKNPVRVRLSREGESGGEQSAGLSLSWDSPLKSGWKIAWKAQAAWWEIAQLEAEIELFEAELESGELSKEETEEVEEELETAEAELEELTSATKSGTHEAVSPTESPAGTLNLVWHPPEGRRITPNLGYTVSILNESSSWNEVQTETNSLWASPYA